MTLYLQNIFTEKIPLNIVYSTSTFEKPATYGSPAKIKYPTMYQEKNIEVNSPFPADIINWGKQNTIKVLYIRSLEKDRG